MNPKTLTTTLTIMAMVVSVAAYAGSYKSSKRMAKKDIVDTAVSAGSFNTLVTAIKAADLVSTLKGKGPFTVNKVPASF